MSESEVTQIRDEDVLRRMWQQTEDFGRKKEIRAHMYKLREERLRDLYSPEPHPQGKGCEFSTAHAQRHGQSFADQTFQSMKSKEVRDASSPTKEFTCRGQDLKELSNAGWNVESEDRTTDDGRTQVKFVNANIEGRYDVEGGQGQFAAVDKQRRAVTEHQDATSSLRRDESSSDSAAREHVVRQTEDGTHVSSTTSSSNTSSKFEQVSSTTHQVPLEDYDQRTHDTNRNERLIKITNDDYAQSLRKNDSSTLKHNSAELVSRKVEYPDDNTRVIVETRVTPDGTRVTSTRREFRVPAQSTRSEYHSNQSESYSSQHTSDHRDSTNTRHTIENRADDIVDSQRNVDDYDFKRQLREYTNNDDDDYSTQHHVTRTNKKVTDHSQTNNEYSQKRYESRVNSKVIDQHQSTVNKNAQTRQQRIVDIDQSTINRADHTQTQHRIVDRRTDYQTDDTDRQTTTRDQDIPHKIVKETRHFDDSEEKVHNISRVRKDHEEHERVSRNRTVIHEGDREIPKDRTTPVDRPYGVPKDKIPTIEKTRDIPRDKTMPVDESHDVPRNDTVPERFREAPSDGTVPDDRPREIPVNRTVTNGKVHHIKKDTQVEEVIEKKTSSDHCQTTYHNDFQSRKVSTDWSPTHQAWASTLRSDTPSTTRPSTRASSPGSKTFKSSTSSLRSSVSPDKLYRKPTSRGGSPTKVDSHSPTRTVTSDRYSSTHSTHSVTQETINKNTSPERKPPTGRSPARSGYSPDRKPQDNYRQRPSASPEKRPKKSSDRPSLSPEQKPADGYPRTTSPLGKKEGPKPPVGSRQSPERRPTYQRTDENPSDAFPGISPYRKTLSPDRKLFDSPDRSSPRSSPSPDRRPGYQKPADIPGNDTVSSPSQPRYSTDDSQPKPGSPGRNTNLQQPTRQADKKFFDRSDRSSPRSSPSPDRRPGYQKPANTPNHPTITSPSKSRYPIDDSPRKPGSPDRKPNFQHSTSQPDRKPFDRPDRSSPRSSPSPDRRPGYQKHADTPGHPTVLSSKPKQQPNRPGEQHPQDSPTKRPSMSPERKPGYIRPTGSSEPDEKTRRLRPENEPDCKSPRKEVPTPISDKEDFTDKTTKIKEDHYRFVDEETKVYTHTDRIITDKKSVKTSSDDDYRPRNKSPSPVHHVTGKDLPDYCNILNPRELPFDMDKPTKDSVFITENDGRNAETVETVDIITSTKYDKQTDENTTKKIAQKKDRPEEKDYPSRETSPSKYGTYDKKKPREKIDTTVVTTITSENAKDVKFDSLTNRDKTSPKKMPGVPTSPVKKSPRDSSSPSKSPTKDTKYKHTTDFITTERTTEEINKKTTTKDRPRQLVTPSSSPTRKPKNTETEPSTGQSSPTTSVSGFVYFGSPCTEKPLVTDLDEPYPETLEDTSKRPENLDVKKSPSPSKIPCRSPSPEKQVPTTKENLPRKSSLKKPSTEFNLVSPVEKPPTNFRVSPTDDKPDLLDDKVVKKDRPSKPETGEPTFSDKPKPPLHRRETYDDRCKKILGLVDNTTTETETGETRKYTRKPDSSQNSPSVSPCDSPTPNDSSPIAEYPATKKTTKVDVTDFIMHEKEDLIKTTTTHNQQKTQIPSRDNSPTKLQDIITKPNLVTDKITNDKTETDIVSKTITPKYPSPRQISEKDVIPESTQKHPDRSSDRKRISSPSKLSKPTESLPAKTNLSPERKPENKYPKDKSPTRPTFDKTVTSTVTSIFDVSTTLDDSKESINITKKTKPTRVLESPTRDSTRSSKTLPEQTGQPRTNSPSKQQPNDGLPVRKSQSPERKITSDTSEPKRVAPYDSQPKESPEKIPGYMKTTTAIKSKYENYHATEDIDETYVTKIQEKKEPRTSSPTYQKLREKSPIKPVHPSDSSTKRPDSSPTRKPTQAAPKTQPDAKQEVPGYMRSTKTTNTKFDKTLISEDVQETNKSSKTIIEKERIPSGSISPTRKHIQPKSPSERTPSPTKPSRPSEMSIDKKPSKFQPTSPIKESSTKKPESKHPAESSLTQPGSEKVPDYMKTTASMTLKHEHDTSYDVKTTEEDTITSTVTEKRYSRDSESPSRPTPKSIDRSSPKYLRTSSPSRPSNNDEPKMHVSPEDKPGYSTKESPKTKPVHPKDTSPTRSKTPSYMTSTDMTATFKTICTTEDVEDFVSIKEKYPSETPSYESPASNRPRTLSPLKPMDNLPRTVAKSPDRKSPVKDNSFPEDKHYIHTPVRTSASPERPSYMKPTASITSKFDTTTTTYKTEDSYVTNVDERRNPSTRKSPTYSPRSPQDEPRAPGHSTKPEEPRQLRTPSPTKKTTTAIETNTDFIMSEREQEILNKVQKSLRKLSPERKEKSPSRERSPSKTTTSLQDLDIIVSETIETDRSTSENLTEIAEEQLTITSKVPRPAQLKDDKSKEQKISNKPSSSNASPIKRTPTAPTSNKVDKNQESPTKPRSFSPKKPMSQADRPHSPQHPKVSGIKPRDQIPPHLTRKPTPATLSTTKIERLTTDIKKTKQNVVTKTSLTRTTNKSILTHTSKINEPDIKRTSTPKKDNASPKKDVVTRTASDTAIKSKKTSSPQRMKSKPEIQVSDMSTKSQKSQKPTIKEPHSKLPTKPKSATSLNTSIDEDDIIIDVQQSKSSRENSPDRICPTPINFVDDVGIPRFPDEVSEPDDDVVKRNHHTIHETESVVDDIVEICEDEELFVKKSDMEVITEQDDSLLSVNDKVSKFTDKIRAVHKPKDTTIIFKDTERNVHSDFVDENLRSDECLLTVSEKVNKFAKVPRDAKDNHSPSRKITDEYDRDTVYTDDYTKLSVNDKAHLFVETAKNIKSNKVKPAQKVERPDLSQVDESLKSDDCLLSVSDKVNKFVKTAEQYDTEIQEVEERETKIKQQHEKVIRQVIDHDDEEEETYRTQEKIYTQETISDKSSDRPEDKTINRAYEPKQSQPKVKNYSSPNSKPVDRVPAVKITTLRSSEAVKKAKALFENIASTQKTNQKEITHTTKTTKLTDIGVIKKSPKSDSTTVLHPSVENISPQVTDIDNETDFIPHTEHSPSDTLTKRQRSHVGEKSHSSPHRLTAQSSEVPRSKSPIRQNVEITTTKTVLSRYPAATRSESPRHRPESPKLRTESPSQRTESPRLRPDSEKPEKVPGYLRPTKTSQFKEETKVEEAEVSSRRGSGKFGIELRRTSAERSTVSSERRRSIEHHQPCIEDIFDVDLLEQMLEKVVGYEQRRRIRAQIRVAKHQNENVVETNTYTKTIKKTRAPKSRSPERKVTKSPERVPKTTPQRTVSPERSNKSTPHKTVLEHTQSKEPVVNGHTTEPTRTATAPRQRPQSPEKPAPKSTLVPKTSVRQPSPDKRRTTSPSKVAPKPKGNRFNEYASAYMKKVGLNESEKNKFTDTKTKKTTDRKQTIKHERQQKSIQEFTTTKNITERTSSKDVIEIVQTNGKRSLSPEQRQSPERKVQFPSHKTHIPDRKVQSPDRKANSPERKPQSPERKGQSPDRKAYSPERKHSPERLHQLTPSPDFKRPKSDAVKATIIKTVYDIEKKIPSKPAQEEKPSWVTNRNLKKITTESRTFSSKKIENEKPKYRAPSPSKVIAKPIDVITSSYGPGPLDADGKPLFGIKALRNGGSNFQVKGTVIRSEFHSRNGGAPEGTVSVTAYSSQPEDLEQLLTSQGAEPPSRIHGLAAITTTKTFGGDTGNTLANVHTKEDRASLEQFTHHDRRVEHLERSYDTTTQELGTDTGFEEISEHTRIEDITGNRRIDSKNDRQDRTDRSREAQVTEVKRQENRRDRTERKKEEVTEVKRQKVEESREKMERREDKKTVRQSSVKSLTEKYIKSANESGKPDRSAYPKAGLILRTTAMRDSVSGDDAPPGGLTRADSEHSICSVDDTVVTTTTERTGDGIRTTTTKTTHHHHHPAVVHMQGTTITHHEPVITTKKTVISQEPVITTRKTMVVTQEPVVTSKRMTVVSQEPVTHRVTQGRQAATVTTERSFLDSNTKVTGVQDILTRMKNADIVIQEGDSTEDIEARALLNKFLGATVLMAGMQGYVPDQADGKLTMQQETVRSGGGGKVSSLTVQELDLDQCWDERLLKKLLEECTDYEQRRRLRARIRTLMAEQEACASAVTEALGACDAEAQAERGAGDARGESLLLPLLQGLLGGGGERLLAGLGAAPADVVADVRRSLGRLRAALAPPAHHPQAHALLALADRLEDALDAADKLDGCRRKPRRRSRANRHTVGVTHEELEEARRLVDRDNLAADMAASSAASTATDESRTPERKPSEGDNVNYHAAERKPSVGVLVGHYAAERKQNVENVSYHSPVAARQRQPPVAHSVSYEPQKFSDEAQVVERRNPPRRPDFFRHSVADAPEQPPAPVWSERRPSESKSSIAAIANKFDANAQMERQSFPRRAPVQSPQRSAPKEETQRSFFRPLPPTYNFAAPPTTQDDSKPLSRFSSSSNKKLRMKRANTIDIGRPLAGLRDDEDEETARRTAPVPEFRPQTENDRKFVAFMKKNEANERAGASTDGVIGQTNWSSRFGNIKNAFERSEREEADIGGPRSSSTSSSARRFWRTAEETPTQRPRPFPQETSSEIIKPPWVTERRESLRQAPPPRTLPTTTHPPVNYNPAQTYIPQPAQMAPPYIPSPAQVPAPHPASAPAPHTPASIPQSPTRPIVIKPFAARPIPVNQFSHAPMSAFKPPAKIPSPTTTPAYVWSPPSLSATASPSTEHTPSFPSSPRPLAAGTPPWQAPEPDKRVNVLNDFQNKYEPIAPPPHRAAAYDPPPPPPPTHAPPSHSYPVKAIPSQNNLAAPELVRRVDEIKYPSEPLKVDAQKLQIEFYERQIREKNVRRELPPAPRPVETDTKPPAPPVYSITDYTPKSNVSSTFVPLQRTPDIEKARAHKVDYLPDVVTNETDRLRSPLAPRAPLSPRSPLPPAYRNGDIYTNGTEGTTEHEMAVTRVMRGPVRGSATITTGVRTRNEPSGAADALRGALDKVSAPKREAFAQKKPRGQVRAPVPNGRSPPPAPHVRPSPPSLGESRESVASSGSIASAGSGLSRSGSWHQLAGGGGGKSASPRRVVTRAKSMHLLAIPKMFEGGIAREEVSEKQRTVEAYFAGAGGTPAALAPARSPPRRSARVQQYALGRSRTMGALSELQFLDESNADDAFEDLVSALA